MFLAASYHVTVLDTALTLPHISSTYALLIAQLSMIRIMATIAVLQKMPLILSWERTECERDYAESKIQVLMHPLFTTRDPFPDMNAKASKMQLWIIVPQTYDL